MGEQTSEIMSIFQLVKQKSTETQEEGHEKKKSSRKTKTEHLKKFEFNSKAKIGK